MTLARPTPAQIRAQVAAVHAKLPDARVVGIRYHGPWDGPPQLAVGAEQAEVACSDSVLQIREWFTVRMEDAPLAVLLTGLEESELGADVIARLAKRRLFQVNRWWIVRDLFKVRDIDPSLARQAWIAEALIEYAPPEGYPPVPSGVLDGETAWRILLEKGLGLWTARPDAVELLRWTLDREGIDRFRSAAPDLRDGARKWIGQTAGAAGEAIVDCVAAGHGHDALAVGLAAAAIFSPEAGESVEAREAAVRLERYCGDSPRVREAAQAWASAAEQVLGDLADRQSAGSVRAWIERADGILSEIGAQALAYRSSVSLKGFEQRLERYGRTLAGALDAGEGEVPEELLAAAVSVFQHAQASLQAERYRRVEMSVRLVKWLRSGSGAEGAPSLKEAAEAYLREGAFVDCARAVLRGAEGSEVLSREYARLASPVGDRRERENERFGRLLSDWSGAGVSGQDVLPIEKVLAEVVAAVAHAAPVLLLVIDGMSVAVWRELLEDLARRGWVPVGREGADRLPPVIAAFPTITEVSRVSLFAGRIASGAAPLEKEGFARHPRLLQVCRPQSPPLLFHKGDLTEGGGSDLATAVRQAIKSGERRVVGAVINAVDDYLLRADQVRPRWTGEYVQTLDALLHIAREAGRVVVITSDHGHVLDVETSLERSEQGDRWRADDGAPSRSEVVLAGPRVMTATGPRIIVPWSERTRYGNRKNGYHGGATPQEVVIPLAVLAWPEMRVEGWAEIAMDYPSWWEALPMTPVARPVPSQAPAPSPPPERGENLVLDLGLRPTMPPAPGAWVDLLLRSPAYAAQKKLVGRLTPPDDRVRTFLMVLDERGGKMTRVALAYRLGQAPIRLGGLIAAMRRLLNVEGYPVLSVDESSETVELNRELLRVQFGIEA